MDRAIEIAGLWKKFRLYRDKTVTLKERLLFFKSRHRWEDFWALQDINLVIEKGRTIGLIGRNGSGKSTLLKLMSRILYPDRGTITVNGRISSLLELGAGIHPDFTGRENIYLNASIFQVGRREVEQKMQGIIDFAELADFIDSPVRSYSSGMFMRLGFAVATSVDPEILLVDEVLAVGDTAFQKKCLDRMAEFKMRKKTIIIVSHSLEQLEKMCDTAIWLNQGRIQSMGEAGRVIGEYRKSMG
ncbi:MAG: ABC transporter ATP-binding protein [Peptococcaceae bacterium]|nr:MAG: ABC transporter ATP-binding protein [Peptococcaceae bacterium]